MKYHVGDKVKIVSERVECMSILGGMDEYLGRTMTIKSLVDNEYKMFEDGGMWFWTDEMIECKVEEEVKTLKNSELWKLAEDGMVNEGDKFEVVGYSADIIVFNGNEFAWDNGATLTMDVTDKWIKTKSKPTMTKEQAEMEFGIRIID